MSDTYHKSLAKLSLQKNHRHVWCTIWQFGKGGLVIVYWGKDGKELKCMEIHESMWVILLLSYELRYSTDNSTAIDVYKLHHT